MHKQYSNQLDEKEQYQRALKIRRNRFPEHDFNIIKEDSKDGSISLIDSPDFDTARTPKVGDILVVNEDGSTRFMKEREKNPPVYHLKYLFVDSEYDGFDADKLEIQHYKETVKHRKLTKRELRRLKLVASNNSPSTRIKNKSPPESSRYVADNYKRKTKILDHGAGEGRGTRYLRKKGFNVTSYDPYVSKSRSVDTSFDKRQKYDIVISDYVINTLTKSERSKYLNDLSRINSKKFIITVRSQRQIEEQKNNNPDNYLPIEDGGYFVISRGVYQKGFSEDELSRLKSKLGKPTKIKSNDDKIIYMFERK